MSIDEHFEKLEQRIVVQSDRIIALEQINRLQAEALADERALNRRYQTELARLRSQSDASVKQ